MPRFNWDGLQVAINDQRMQIAKDIIMTDENVTAAFITADNLISGNNQMAIALLLHMGEMAQGTNVDIAKILVNCYTLGQLQGMAVLSLKETDSKATIWHQP